MTENSESRVKGIGYRVILALALLLMLSAISYQLSAEAADDALSSIELIEKSKEFDGKKVIYKGEVIGAVLNRGEYSWANLNDGANAIGVWCKTSDLAPIRVIGGYKRRGDILTVEGLFNRVCAIHGGETDIHAQTLKVERHGYLLRDYLDKNRLILSFLLFLVTLSFTIIFRRRI